ncbi:hypothetical protein STEG23_019291, partial [Scotinomys teguina]
CCFAQMMVKLFSFTSFPLFLDATRLKSRFHQNDYHQENKNSKCDADSGKEEPLHTAGGNVSWNSTYENQ